MLQASQCKCHICDQSFQTESELHEHNRKAHSRAAAIRRIPGGVASMTDPLGQAETSEARPDVIEELKRE